MKPGGSYQIENPDESEKQESIFIRITNPWWVKVIFGIVLVSGLPVIYSDLDKIDKGQVKLRDFPQPPDRFEQIYKLIGKWPTIYLIGGLGAGSTAVGFWQLYTGRKKF
jgi:hypothetical protein